MKSRLLLVCLLVLLFYSSVAQGFQTSRGIESYGTIKYPANAQSTVIKRYTGTFNFEGMDAGMIAELYDMCQVFSFSAAEKIQQVHQMRPDFRALLYRNIRAIYSYREDEWQTALDSNWILKDENGQLVYSTTWPINYMVDIGNPEYQKWVASWIKENIDMYRFDGVFADNSIAAWASEVFWGTSASPVNPRTGNFWKDEEVRQALIEVHKEIKKAIGSKPLVCNGIFEGHRFWERYDGYMEFLSDSPLDGFMSEGLWYQYFGVWMSEERWLECLDFLIFVQDNFLKGGPERVFVPYTCASKNLPSGCTGEQMATYAFASTLLGVKSNQNYLGLTADVNVDITQVIRPLYHVDAGTPTNDYYLVEGTHVYARDFSNIKVLVNPTSDSYIIDLQGTFETLDGETVSGITMEDHSGLILVKGENS